MKIIIFISAIIITVCIACNTTSNSSEPKGTFVNYSKGEYSLAFDTLIITPLNQTGNSFQVERKTGYQKIRDGITRPKEYKTEKWQSSWDEETQTLSETEYGRQITSGKDGKSLMLKTTEYQKIK